MVGLRTSFFFCLIRNQNSGGVSKTDKLKFDGLDHHRGDDGSEKKIRSLRKFLTQKNRMGVLSEG